MLEQKLLGVLQLGGFIEAPSSGSLGEGRAWSEKGLQDGGQRHGGSPMCGRSWDCGSGGGLDMWLLVRLGLSWEGLRLSCKNCLGGRSSLTLMGQLLSYADRLLCCDPWDWCYGDSRCDM